MRKLFGKSDKDGGNINDEIVSDDSDLGTALGSGPSRSRKTSSKSSKKKSASFHKSGSGAESDVGSEADGDGSKKLRKSRSKKSSSTRQRERVESTLDKRQDEENRYQESESARWVTGEELYFNMDADDVESGRLMDHASVQEYLSAKIVPETPEMREPIQQTTQAKIVGPVYDTTGALDNCSGRVLVPKPNAQGKVGFGQWREEVYVESESGRFHKKLYDLDQQGIRIASKTSFDEYEMNSLFTPEILRKKVEHLQWALEALFMFGQGTLCGAALFQVLVVFQVIDNQSLFLMVYGPIAKEIRRLFFFLCVIALVSSMDKVAHERHNTRAWRERGIREKAEMYLYVLFYTLNLIVSLVAYRPIDEIYQYYLLQEGLATNTIIPTRSLSYVLSLWKSLVILRFAFSTCGWLLMCNDVQRDIVRGRNRAVALTKMTDKLTESENRIARMGGKSIDNVPIADLETLEKELNLGLLEVQLQLRLRRAQTKLQ